MASINFASTACSAGNRGQLVDANTVSQWHATATRAGKVSSLTLRALLVRSLAAEGAPTVKG
ncbi:hypothetical protein ACKAV7_008768 [Fusarium commune]